MVAQAQALNFSSRRHVDLRRVGTAACRPPV
ncbi:putative leader peptide [Streptomyces sp. LUP30]